MRRVVVRHNEAILFLKEHTTDFHAHSFLRDISSKVRTIDDKMFHYYVSENASVENRNASPETSLSQCTYGEGCAMQYKAYVAFGRTSDFSR